MTLPTKSISKKNPSKILSVATEKKDEEKLIFEFLANKLALNNSPSLRGKILFVAKPIKNGGNESFIDVRGF